MSGKLILCGTPIGNLEDMSPRAVRVLSEASVIACEDTRRTKKLLSHFGIAAPELVVYNETNEKRQVDRVIGYVTAGRRVVLVSDAGMPGLSDPGYRLVAACAEREIAVEVIPGPSAALTALVGSGLPPARFVFEGFLPRKSGARRARIQELVHEPRTIVVYESPHRIAACLRDLAEVLGDRRAVLARELTKLHEELRRGSLSQLLAGVDAEPARGEIVIVVEGASGFPETVAPEALAAEARALMDQGVERKEAMGRVARSAGVPRRVVFDALLRSD